MAFATVEDLATHLRRDLSAADSATAAQALDGATRVIQSYTGQTIEQVTGDSVELIGEGTQLLQLPQTPVTAVTSVTTDADGLLASTSYRWTTGGLLYRVWGYWGYSVGLWSSWAAAFNLVTVVYNHGYAVIPDDIRWVCLEVAARVFDNPSAAQSTTVGSVSQTFGAGNRVTGIGLSDSDKEALSGYGLVRVG